MTDTHERELASDPQRSVLLQAPAGSGKTTVLTERLLRLLARVDAPEEILAITFTRKAAAEMRTRVLRALRGEIDGNTPQEQRTRELAAAALRWATERGWKLLEDPGRLRIQTIDSFNFRLASQLTVTAKVGATLTISDRPRELYELAARQTLAAAEKDPQLAADVELLFERLDNHWRYIERLLASMLPRRGHWLPYVLAHDPDTLCRHIDRSLAQLVHEQLTASRSLLDPALRALAEFLPGLGPLGADPARLVGWQKLAHLVLTQENEWRKPRGLGRKLAPELEDPAIREMLAEVIARMSAVPGLREQLAEVACLPPPALPEPDAAALCALSRVLCAAAVQLQTEFAVAARVDHTYVAGAARAALLEAGAPTDLGLRTGLALRHILVDEFQDTSLAQFDLLEALVAGWEEGDGRTLFAVGDPMQSIYQFREAEVGLFLRARERGIGGVRLQSLQLQRNFRSAAALIEWANQTFAQVFPAQDDLRASAVSFTPSVAGASAVPTDSAPPQPLVRFRLFAADRDAETAFITQRIAELRTMAPTAKIAVLVAARTHAAPIMTALEANNLDAIGVDLVPLSELPVVRDLVALVRATGHLADRTAWLTVLRAPWCGVSLATLTQLSQRKESALPWEAIGNPQRLALYHESDRGRLVRLHEEIGVALRSRQTLSLADWVERLWLRLGAADAYSSADLEHARAFFTRLSERVANGEWSGLTDLESLLDDLFAAPQARTANPIQVMTIHRAKGLEFDHVLVPGLDRPLERGREPLLRWLDLPRAEGESDLIMAPAPVIGDETAGTVGAYVKRLINRRASNEQTRLLYVAATRAKRTLDLSAAPPARADGSINPRAGTLLARLWPALVSQDPGMPLSTANVRFSGAETGVAGVSKTGGNTTGGNTTGGSMTAASLESPRLQRLPAQWTLPPLPPAVSLPRLPLARESLGPPEFSWVGETARHIGTVVHSSLERFARLERLPDSSAIESQRHSLSHQLWRHGVPQRDLPRATQIVIDALTRTVNDEQGRWIFDCAHREARSELSLTGIARGRLSNVVIDRSFVDSSGTRWVIDFKTSRHEGSGLDEFLQQEMERYRGQLQTYVALARGLGSEPVRAALYFPLLERLIEVADD